MAFTTITIDHLTEEGDRVKVPARISVENGAIYIKIEVPKEYPIFPDRSRIIQELGRDCEAHAIKHELLLVGRLALPDCIKILCQ